MAEVQAAQAVESHPPLNLIPVGLKEAALDSPTFRATALHFADNVDAVERWLDGYVKAASRLVSEVASLEAAVNSFLGQSTPPAQISEAVLDHDYTLLAMRSYGEGAREFWQTTFRTSKRHDTVVLDPIKNWLINELRSFKEARRSMENAQKSFDNIITRYMGQSKAKEASSLREGAFQLHEARKLYLRSSMDYCVEAPQLRASLDKLLARIFAEQWKEMRQARDSSAAAFAKWSSEIDRVRGWSRELENSERAFKRELLTARKQIEESAEGKMRPSRELEDYSASTVPYLGTGASSATGANKSKDGKAEKQGWLFLKTVTGKPAKTVWSRRWFFVKNGIFGWLIHGTRSGGVEESERTGVLLCSVRPVFQEERRFCFEIKTKDQSATLQAETQQELTEWISAFEVAKRKALQHPASTETSRSAPGVDPAFAISPPVAPEFAAKVGEGHAFIPGEEIGLALPERAETGLGSANHASFDVNPARRVMSLNQDTETGLRENTRDHAARIISKLDLHKRPTASPQLTSAPTPAGGIASLISASHNILPVGPGTSFAVTDGPKRQLSMPLSTLAPSTLANPPAATNLSHTAVVVSGERGIGLGRSNDSGVPSGILANLWGSSNWGYVNRLGDAPPAKDPSSHPGSPPLRARSTSQDDSIIMDGMNEAPKHSLNSSSPALASAGHRKNLSIGTELPGAILTSVKEESPTIEEDYPSWYPLPLKAQDAQFRMLFPTLPKDEKVVLVFRATWNPNDQQEFPGRVYVTAREINFFSNHLGLVLITSVILASLSEVTAAPGRDCDFLYLHLRESIRQGDARRVTVKLFLEPLKLLQRRLNYLVHNAGLDEPAGLEAIIKTLIKMESEEPRRSSSVESWEDVAYLDTEGAAADQSTAQRRRERNIKASLRIDGNLYGETPKTGREIQKFKLPARPIVYAPQGMQATICREFAVSAKALFHVMFGDNSAVFQLLYCNRWGVKIVQTPWTRPDKGHWTRKFASQNDSTPMADRQTIDVFNDHLCYVVTNNTYPWQLPYADSFSLTTKFVITHTAKSRCKLAVFQKLTWHKAPPMAYLKNLIERQAYNSLEADALDLSNVAMDQVAKLGRHSKTNKAVEIFGSVGHQTRAAQIDGSQVSSGTVPAMTSVQIAPVPLPRLVLNDAFAKALGALSVVFDLMAAIGKGAINLCTAHTLLVAALVVSALYNGWHGYRDGLVWYHEKNAARFLSRLGVGAEPQMSRVIYLSNLEELVAPTAENETVAALNSSAADTRRRTCRSTFAEHLTSSSSVARHEPTGARLNLSRDALARYRHDLVVALRVVNRVEKDVILAQWEEWVRSEDQKCRRVNDMVRHVHERRDAQQKREQHASREVSGEHELGDGFAEYCNSCRTEVSGLDMGNRLL